MSSFVNNPHYFFYDFLSFLMFSLIFMNMIISISYQYVDGFYLSIHLIPSLVHYGNGQLNI